MTSIGSTASTKALQTTPTDALAKTYARDGVIFLPSALHAAQTALVEAAFDYSMAHPGPVAFPAPPEDGPFFYSDNGASASWRTEPYLRLFRETPIGAICQALFGSKAVWFINEQLFWKQGGAISRTPWHQDTSYFKFDGPDQAVVWVALDDLPQGSAIEVVRGSHNGPLYDGFGTVTGKGEVTGDSAVCDGALPPLPDIEAERAAWDIVTWSINRGDLIIFHPRALHGGALAH